LDTSETLHQLGLYAAVGQEMPEFEAALRTMNEVMHGIPVEPQAAESALATGRRLVEELRRLRVSRSTM